MSIELDWSVLDTELALSCQHFLNQAFARSTRPSFLAEVVCTEFAFGEGGPDVELVDIRDIYTDFLEADADADAEEAAAQVTSSFSSDVGSSWRAASDSRRVSPTLNTSSRSAYTRAATSRPPMYYRSQSAPYFFDRHSEAFPPSPLLDDADNLAAATDSPTTISLQLHLRLSYSGALRFGIRTAFLVNHPAPGFLKLPLNIVVTAIAFKGVLVVAYEGGRKRIHIALLDPGPPPPGMGSPPSAGHRTRPAERLLTDLVCESEMGQADKHVLRNVGKVEKFVLEVVRGALEDEIIYPNFQTLAWHSTGTEA